jgi:DNA polymerase delta subunit 2
LSCPAVVKILSVGEDQEVAVIGTLYKDMKLKPSILDEYAKQPGFKQALGGTGGGTSSACTHML